MPAPEAARTALVRAEPWWGLSLVESGTIPPAAGEPAARVTGFCPNCGHPCDFGGTRPGQVIAGRYEIKRTLGAGHPACPPSTASMLHRCRGGSSIDAPLMPFEGSTPDGAAGTGGTGCISDTVRRALGRGGSPYEAVTSAVEGL